MQNNTNDRNEVSANNESNSLDTNVKSAKSESKIRRRNVLRGVASAGVFASTLPAIGSATPDEEVEVTDVNELSGSKKQQVIERARSSSEFELIESSLIDKGFEKESSEAFVSHSPDRDFYTVTIRYTNEDENAGINWSSLEDVETTGIVQSPERTYPVTVSSLTQENQGELQLHVDVPDLPDLPDLPGCPDTDWVCFYQTIVLNANPGINCSICLGGMVAGDTARCSACLKSLSNMYRPCTICTGN